MRAAPLDLTAENLEDLTLQLRILFNDLYDNTPPLRNTRGIWVPATSLRVPTANGATWVDHGAGGAWQFPDNLERGLTGSVRLPSDLIKTEDVALSICWSSPAVLKACHWDFTYQVMEHDVATDYSGLTLPGYHVSSSTANGMKDFEFTIPSVDLTTNSHCIHFTIKRHGNDVGDTLGDVAHLHGITMEFTTNRWMV
jgi:hypothetical protein